MANRLSREPMSGGTGVVLGWIAAILGLGAGVVTALEGASVLPLALGLLLAGALWIVHGKYLSRRPARYLQVDADGLRLMPEGQQFQIDGLGPLRILETQVVTSEVNVAYAATVYAQTADVALIRLVERTEADARAAAEAWIARLEDAMAGRLAPDQLTALDARIEGPAPAFVAGSAALSVGAIALVALGYGLASPAMLFGIGVGVFGAAAVSAWRLIERRGVARLVGLAVGAALILRPIVAPVTAIMAPETTPEALGLFAEGHLGFLIGGAVAVIAGLVAGHRPKA